MAGNLVGHTGPPGGGIFLGWHGGTIKDSAIHNNSTQSAGGGISFTSSYDSELRIINSTITQNTADGNGGGIQMAGSSFQQHYLYLLNSTVASNWADYDRNETGDGGGLQGGSLAEVVLLSSIIAANRDGSTAMRHGNCSGFGLHNIGGTVYHTTTSYGGNVLGGAFATRCPPLLSAQASSAPDVAGQRPRFADPEVFADTYVVPIRANSPAVEAGYCGVLPDLQVTQPLELDQRGKDRDPQSCDCGAYER